MRRAIVGICILLCALSSRTLTADSCKPDFSGKDSITKKQLDQWQQVLRQSGIMSAALMGNDVTFTGFVQRGGDKNFVMISIQKVEENLARATFESQYSATKGDQIMFGFADGDPLSFTATEVSNQAKAGAFSGKLNMSVVWAAELSDEQMAEMRTALTTQRVDAIRITASSGTIDLAVPEKNGSRLLEKFGCFYQSMDARGILLGSPTGGQGSTSVTGYDVVSVQGMYLRKGQPADFIELRDGKFSMSQDGHTMEGTYSVEGADLNLRASWMRRTTAHLSGDTIRDNEGIIWEKQTESKASASKLTIDQIIQMVNAKLADDIIVTTIKNSGTRFDLTPETLIKLKSAGVSDVVVRAMAP